MHLHSSLGQNHYSEVDVTLALFIDKPVATFSDNVREFKAIELEKSTEIFHIDWKRRVWTGF